MGAGSRIRLTQVVISGGPLRACRGRRCPSGRLIVAYRLDARAGVSVFLSRRVCPRGRCSFRSVAVLAFDGEPGRNEFRLGPRVNRTRLGRGRYRLCLRAEASGRRRSRTVTATFRVV